MTERGKLPAEQPAAQGTHFAQLAALSVVKVGLGTLGFMAVALTLSVLG